MSWTDERIDNLKTLWAAGYSASQIAGRLGGATRNSVIGKVHRLGLAGRATVSRTRCTKASHTTQMRTTRKPRTPPAASHMRVQRKAQLSDGLPELAPAPEQHPTIATLQPADCRWPIGGPKQPGFHFCGRPHDRLHCYCAHHYALATRRHEPDTTITPPAAAFEAPPRPQSPHQAAA